MADNTSHSKTKQTTGYSPGYPGTTVPVRRRRRCKRVTPRFYLFLAGAFLLTVAAFWAGSFLQIVSLERQIVATKADIEIIKQKNAQLAAEIELMGTDSYVEEMAREQLGLVKEGEKAYAVVQPVEPEDQFQVEKRPGISASLYH